MPRLAGKTKAVKGENITVRLSKRHRFALELLSRKRGVNYTTIVIDALEAFMRDPAHGLIKSGRGGQNDVYIPDDVWDPAESDRLLNIATRFPELLSDEEHYLWKVIKETPRFYPKGDGPNYHEVRTHWQWIQDEAKKLEKQLEGAKNG